MRNKRLALILAVLMAAVFCSACDAAEPEKTTEPDTPALAEQAAIDETEAPPAAQVQEEAPAEQADAMLPSPYKDAYERLDLNYDYAGRDMLVKTKTLDGEDFDTKDVFSKARLTVVTVWSTTCSACTAAMPIWSNVAFDYEGSGVAFLGICCDALADGSDVLTVETAKQIAAEQGMRYPQLAAGDEVLQKILSNIMYLPTTFFVNSEGKTVCAEAIGYIEKLTWVNTIETILAEME